MSLRKLYKKAEAGGFGVILPIVMSLLMAGFVMTIITDVNSDIAGSSLTTNVSRVSTNVNNAVISFSSNYGTFFSLALIVVIIGAVAVFLVRRG